MALEPPISTPWGPAGAIILCVLPIVFLLLVTVVKQLLLPTSVSLPVAAAMLAFIRLAYLSTPAVLVSACCLSGLLEALTPLSIITGAIMLFQTMQHTKVGWMAGWVGVSRRDDDDGVVIGVKWGQRVTPRIHSYFIVHRPVVLPSSRRNPLAHTHTHTHAHSASPG